MKKIDIIYLGIFTSLVIVIFPFIFSLNSLSGGDYTSTSSYVHSLLASFSSWCSYINLGYDCAAIHLHYSPLGILFERIAAIFRYNTPVTERIIWWIPFLLGSFISSLLLARKLFPSTQLHFLTPIIYTFNTYILMVVGGGQISGIGLGYAFYPLTIYFWANLIEKRRVVDSLICGICISMIIILDPRVALVSALTVFIFCLHHVLPHISNKKHIVRDIFLFFILPSIVALATHFYWILPLVISGTSPLGQLGQAYDSTNAVRYFSFAKLENSLALMHPNWPKNIFGLVGFMKSEFLIFPILAFSFLLFQKKVGRRELSIALIGLVGVFLAKGVNEPAGQLYEFLFNNFPGFSLFRDPTKWYFLIALSYSLLIPLSLIEISKRFKRSEHLLAVVFLGFFVFTLIPIFSMKLGIKTVNMPADYIKLEGFLNQERDFFRTLWIPTYQRFGLYNNNHPVVVGIEQLGASGNEDVARFLSTNKNVIQVAGIKYLIVPYDSEKEIFLNDRKYDERLRLKLISDISRVEWLKRLPDIGRIAVWEVPNAKNRFTIEGRGSIPFLKINDTQYQLFVQQNNKQTVIFNERFSQGWYAQQGDTIIQSKPYLGMVNSFQLEAKSAAVSVYYKPQEYVTIGLGVSVITFLAIAVFIVYKLKNEKLKK